VYVSAEKTTRAGMWITLIRMVVDVCVGDPADGGLCS
jgi:hypothetical protein